MKKWLRLIRDAAATGLAWAAGWTLIGMLGVVVFYALYPGAPDVVDIWIPVFAYPGFLAGVGFSVLLRVAEGRRSFDEVSLSRLAAWGAAVGLLVGVLPFALGTPSDRFPLWLLGVIVVASTTTLSLVSAVASALLYRYFVRRKIPIHTGPER
jgi:O-antigen/teichoic acid export membrane protein